MSALGVDLTKKAGEIRRIVLAGFHVDGLDEDDLVQEVLLAIHRRNTLPSAYNPERCSFSHYVHLVAGNVVGHMLAVSRWRGEAGAEEVPDVVDEREPLAALELIEEARSAGVNVEASREAGELVYDHPPSVPPPPSSRQDPAPRPDAAQILRILERARAALERQRRAPLAIAARAAAQLSALGASRRRRPRPPPAARPEQLELFGTR